VGKGGPETVALAGGVTETARQLAAEGIVLAGVTEKVENSL